MNFSDVEELEQCALDWAKILREIVKKVDHIHSGVTLNFVRDGKLVDGPSIEFKTALGEEWHLHVKWERSALLSDPFIWAGSYCSDCGVWFERRWEFGPCDDCIGKQQQDYEDTVRNDYNKGR